ncbi:hypothetical protein [Bacillus massiliigorillae]|uniref:hypothetical protein n=1 Tax=Bacillus massiliigorillae TaxID=1243664 RepID=UPI00039CB8FD|nr:hypothetical protein [Bacillus massiliigorillae]
MKNKAAQYIPLVVTVGQVVIFPYYILWLKDVSLSYMLFAWMFAAFSFSAAWGYRVFQTTNRANQFMIPFIYIGMGLVYTTVGSVPFTIELLPYIALVLQVILGFLQGCFRGWHAKQATYHLHVTSHYLLVGMIMIGLSFIRVVSPGFFLTIFGIILCICGVYQIRRKRSFEK